MYIHASSTQPWTPKTPRFLIIIPPHPRFSALPIPNAALCLPKQKTRTDRQTKKKFVTVIVVVDYTLPPSNASQTPKIQTDQFYSLPRNGGAGMRRTGNPPVSPVPPLPDLVVDDISPVVADLSPIVVAADRVVPPPILTFLATAASCASLTRWTGDGGAVGGRRSASGFRDAGSGGNGAGVASGHVDDGCGSPSGTSTSSLTALLVGGAGIRITGNFSPPPPPLISLTCPTFLLAKSSILPTFQSHLPPPSAGSWRRDEGVRRRTVIAETSGGGRCRDRAKGFTASNAAQMRHVP